MAEVANDQLRRIAVDIARQAGELAARRRSEGVHIAGSKSSLVDIVTLADQETEAFIRSALADVRPGDGFYGEESGAEVGTTGVTWVVDPIDGTVNYLYGLPDYNVSIAAVEGDPTPETWTALAGAVVAPALGEVYSAALGEGATLNGDPIRVTEHPELTGALIATGFGYDAAKRRRQALVLAELLLEARDIRRGGAAALDLCRVAAGKLDGYFEQGLQPWDHAAAALIAREAGARVTGFDNTPPGRLLTLAANPRLAPLLEAIVAEHSTEM